MTSGSGIAIPLSVLESVSRKYHSIREASDPQSRAAAAPSVSNRPSSLSVSPLSVSFVRGICVCSLRGALDRETAPEFLVAAEALCKEPGMRVALIMSAAGAVDGDGYGALLRLQRRLTDMGGKLTLVGCPEEVRTTLAVSRLEMILPHVRTVRDIPQP